MLASLHLSHSEKEARERRRECDKCMHNGVYVNHSSLMMGAMCFPQIRFEPAQPGVHLNECEIFKFAHILLDPI